MIFYFRLSRLGAKRLYLFLEVSLGSYFEAELHCVSSVEQTESQAKVAYNICKILDNEKRHQKGKNGILKYDLYSNTLHRFILH